MPIISGPVFPLGVDQHNAVANGQYYCVNRNQTGTPTQAALGSFFDTSPYITIFNSAGQGGPSIYMDFITLVNTASGTGGTSLLCSGMVDFLTTRSTSTGVDLTQNIANPNGNFPNISVAKFWVRAATVAHTTTRRTIWGQRQLLGTNPIPGDTTTVKFGGNNSSTTIAISTISYATANVPKVVIPPQGVFIFTVWLPGPQTVAGSYITEAGWIEA